MQCVQACSALILSSVKHSQTQLPNPRSNAFFLNLASAGAASQPFFLGPAQSSRVSHLYSVHLEGIPCFVQDLGFNRKQ